MTDLQPTPTREARTALAAAEFEARCTWYYQNPDVPHMRALGWPHHLDYHLACAFDRFAARHSTAAPVSGDAREDLRLVLHSRFETELSPEVANYIVALIAAAEAEGRRAAIAVIEMWDPYADRWDDIPYDNPTIKALMLRALAAAVT